MTNEDIIKIGEEFERFLNPVYEQLDRVEKTQAEHTDKIDALMAEIHNSHQELGAHEDKTNFGIDKIKEHTGIVSAHNT